MQTKIIYLVGPMGAGKSTVGRMLAKELNMPFKDSDREIEERCGASIAWIFDIEGEEGFRKREIAIIEELSYSTGVISTGAGVITSEENRKIMSSTGIVVFLDAAMETLIKRTEKDKNRPLLQCSDRSKRVKELYEERYPFYSELADITVVTDDGSPKNVVQKIMVKINKLN